MHGVIMHVRSIEASHPYVVHNPEWWRVWAWLTWLYVILTKRSRGHVTVSALKGSRVEHITLRVFRRHKR